MAQAKLNFDAISAARPSKTAKPTVNLANPYRYTRRTRGLFDPQSRQPFRLSRSRLENFIRCRRCFYLDNRLGIPQPAGYPFTLNSAVDHLLKKEFDIHRLRGTSHPLMKAYNVDAVPYNHPDLDAWRENFTGVQYLHPETNFLITGAVDDVWINAKKELLVVDYKSTAKDGEVNIDADWQDGYKRQMEIYQWLLRRNNFPVSATGYFVYANGQKDRKAFDAKLEFDVHLFAYTGDDSWVEDAICQARKNLEKKTLPEASPDCDYCAYRKLAQAAE